MSERGTAIVFDTETTGLEAPEIIEAAWAQVDLQGRQLGVVESARFRPDKPITLAALATHHIKDEDLHDCPPSWTFSLPAGVDYLIGHNVDFDWRAIGEPKVKRIDVCAFCRQLWPHADSHSQGAMLYLLERGSARELLREAHSAASDVAVCMRLLRHVLTKLGPFESWEGLWQACERARIPTHMPFGKHKGMPIAQVPADYKRWLLKQPDVDPYLTHALRTSA